MKYLCFLAYLLINLVNCRFFVTSDYSLQKQVQYTLFCFYALVFIKLKLRVCHKSMAHPLLCYLLYNPRSIVAYSKKGII